MTKQQGTGNGKRGTGKTKQKTSATSQSTKKKKTPSPSSPLPAPRSQPTASTRAGFVAILGAPNAGKSTLLNRFIGQKVSIVSPKAQTTRIRTLGIMSEGDTQISFIDTPGIFAATSRLDQAMVGAAWNSLADADVVMVLVDASARRENEKISAIIDGLKERLASPLPRAGRGGEGGQSHQKMILVMNKIDAIDVGYLLPLVATLNESGIFTDTFMISALTGDGTDDLKQFLKKHMPASPWFYGDDQISDLPAQILAAELTREQIYRQLQQELPYAAAVLPESLTEKRDGSVMIHQKIVVARDNHRSIFLGKGGARIKSIGERARADIARLFDRKVHLFLTVKCDEKWQDRPSFYNIFGLDYGKK